MTTITPDYPYNYTMPTTNFYIDHNYYVSTGIYGNFYNYDGHDASNNIIQANSYIQRDISISGNLYCTSLYTYIDNQILNSYNTLSGVITLDISSFVYYTAANDLYKTSISDSIYSLYNTIHSLNIPTDLVTISSFIYTTNSVSGSIFAINNKLINYTLSSTLSNYTLASALSNYT